jgi:hypothetical protein
MKSRLWRLKTMMQYAPFKHSGSGICVQNARFGDIKVADDFPSGSDRECRHFVFCSEGLEFQRPS